jgi:hypothetical protein
MEYASSFFGSRRQGVWMAQHSIMRTVNTAFLSVLPTDRSYVRAHTDMKIRRSIRVSLLVAVVHFVLTSVIGYYAAYRIGGAAGESIAHLLTDGYESHGAMSEQTIEEHYRAIKSTAEATAASWEPVLALVHLPIGFALEPMFEPVSRGWNDQALANELSYSQWKMRVYALILFKYLLNSVCLGFLVYLGLRIAKRSAVD